MKCLKAEEYIKRTASLEDTEVLFHEVKSYVKGQACLQGRTLCDRVIRACNHQLGVGSPCQDHINQLVKLVELSLHGYDISAALVGQSSPLYMEKIVFHIVKKLSAQGTHTLCSHVAELLYNRLSTVQQVEEDFSSLVRSCFSVLWNGISAAKEGKNPNHQDKLHYRIQALSFLLLLDNRSTTHSLPTYAHDVITEFESSCGQVTKDKAFFLLQEMQTCFNRCWLDHQGCEDNKLKRNTRVSHFYGLSEMVLMVVKVLCKANHYNLATTFLKEIETKISDCVDCTVLDLGKWGVKIHSASKDDKENGQAFTECARALRSLSAELDEGEARAVLRGCSLVVWAVESGHNKILNGAVLLAFFSFLEEHQERILKMLNQISDNQVEVSKLQKALCLSIYQGLVFAHESLLASQLENPDTLDRVLLYCQSTAGLMMTELQKLSSENLIMKAVTAVNNVACGLYNKRLYEYSFTLVEILCRGVCKNCPASLSVEWLNRLFMLAVQASRRAGQLERALDWVIIWLKALGDKMTCHMTEPISLWVKTKIDAARNSDEDMRLRTLRDGFGPNVPDEQVMLCILEEELRAYKEVAGDTAKERYNTLCDLLEICHEESPHKYLRAVYLCEMAQVVCFQDFSEQTDCSAVDFIHEALRLLEEETETSENADKLKDDRAHALVWLYICTLEKNLQEAIKRGREQKACRDETQCETNPIVNDFDYDNKQKTQEFMVYEGLQFSLAVENELCQPLEKALDEWSSLFLGRAVPSVRNPKQTSTSITVTAALFKLIGKPLKALEAYQLVIGFSRQLGDIPSCAKALCQSASLLLDLGTPRLALAQLEQAEKVLSSDTTAEGPSPLNLQPILLKAQYYYNTGQVECGVPHLCKVLKEVNEQRQSKSWYLLRVQTLQTCSSYLSLDTANLSQKLRSCITLHGISTPDSALYESLKLLCSLLVALVGQGLYGTYSSSSPDVSFVDQGDNLVVKWQLLSALLNCSVKMVALRSSCGAVNDAKLQCLEALRLAIKLQSISQCAELLVMKAELELMQGEIEESRNDLDKVRSLLELCMDSSAKAQKSNVKIKPRKCRPLERPQSTRTVLDDELKDFLSIRWIPKEPVVDDQPGSPPLKAQPRRWLSSLAHNPGCLCPCCSEPCLGRATVRWAVTQADLLHQVDSSEDSVGSQLHCVALSRSEMIATKVAEKLSKIFSPHGSSKILTKPSLMQDIVGQVYLHMALFGLQPKPKEVCGIWGRLDAGFSFVDSCPSPALRPVRAGLLLTKAIASVLTLAAEKGCTPEELFSNVWTWNAPKEMKLEKRAPILKKPKDSVKNLGVLDKSKEAKKAKPIKAKFQEPTCKSSRKYPVPKTPKSGSSVKENSCFDFNNSVPTLACTPLQKVKTSGSVQRAPRTASKLQFHVYEELSPAQDKAQPVPDAPKRLKKLRFQVDFSDESDSETKDQTEAKEKAVPKKRTTAKRAVSNAKTTSNPPTEKAAPKRQVKGKKSTALPLSTSSEDDDTLIGQSFSARRGRSRRPLSKSNVEVFDEPDKMRTIEEESQEVLDISFEQMRTSENEAGEDSTSPKDNDLEVLRRDICWKSDALSELKGSSDVEGPHPHFSHSDNKPAHLVLEDVQSLLRSAWVTVRHLPPPTTYPTLCCLLALTTGQQEPETTAMLHAESLGVTNRHRAIRHFASCRRKMKKANIELAEKLDTLSLDENKSARSTSSEQKLCQMETIYSFSTAAFPESQEFKQLIQHLPQGVTVCMMSVLGVKPGVMGDSILLSHLGKDSAPVTVHIPTDKEQHSISWLVQEFDSIQAEQKVVNCFAEKAKWWESRTGLDSRVEQLLKKMEGLLGCWKSLLLPASLDPVFSKEAHLISKALSSRGVKVSEEMLKVVLSASHMLTEEDLKRFALGVSSQWDAECEKLLQKAMSRVSFADDSRGHMILILDKYLQRLPWESISILKSHSVTRMPSLHSLLGLSIQKESDSESILNQGVSTKKVFYVLDPNGNLERTQDRFREWFCSEPDWQGVCGVAPDPNQLQEAVVSKDLYIYLGHGAGSRFLDSTTILKQPVRAASLLFGCSSAALAVRGSQEGQGIILSYLLAGCPFVLGNLWDVTDADLDRFTKALLQSWFAAPSGASLLDYMDEARQATHFKHLIGAAPVVYGLPIHLM